MLATFALRLACGMAGALLVLSPTQVAPRFYRTQFLTILGFVALAGVVVRSEASVSLWCALAASLLLAFLGSFVWSLENSPGGQTITVLSLASLVASIALLPQAESPAGQTFAGFTFADDLTSAALLGAAMSSMLMGHSYLVAPGMTIAPLLRLLTALFIAVGLRMACAGVELWWMLAPSSGVLPFETLLWLPVRWGLGFVGPLVLGWMAWQAAKIRSTQSATGILYVVVVFVFLGELTGLLLHSSSPSVP